MNVADRDPGPIPTELQIHEPRPRSQVNTLDELAALRRVLDAARSWRVQEFADDPALTDAIAAYDALVKK